MYFTGDTGANLLNILVHMSLPLITWLGAEFKFTTTVGYRATGFFLRKKGTLWGGKYSFHLMWFFLQLLLCKREEIMK